MAFLSHYLACDLGAESGRVMLGIFDGTRLSLEELHRFPNGAVRIAGTLRWNVLRLFEEVKRGLQIAARRAVPIESISVDSWGVDFVLTRRREPLLRQPYHYRDRRNEIAFRELSPETQSLIFEQTGVQFMPINTLYQLLADLREDPALLQQADRLLQIADWFHLQLCGRGVSEETNASTTQIYNPRRRAWSEEIIEHFGLPWRIFPEIVKPGTVLDTLLAELQEETGLGAVPIVAGCTHDTAAAVAAIPAEGENWAFLSSGTWSLIGLELPRPLISEAARAANFTNEVGYAGRIRFLKNIVGLWLLQECRRIWERQGQEISYAELTDQAAAAPVLRSLIYPNHARFLAPENMPEEIAAACRASGQPAPETPGEFARCIFESLALLYRVQLDGLEKLTGRQLDTLHIVGGGSRNLLLNQLAADATGRQVVAGPVEATALGNVLVQALAMQQIDSLATARQIVAASFSVERFTPGPPENWAEAHARFQILTA